MNQKKNRTVVLGIYETRSSVDSAVDQLKLRGFRNSDISVLMPTQDGWEEYGSKEIAQERNAQTSDGVTTGATSGALLGGGLGWLVGLGSLAIPGIGPFIAAGPIMAALAGMGVGGAVGGIAGALIGSGIPEHEAKRFEGRVKNGGILLSVHGDDSAWMHQAKEVLLHTGGKDIASTDEETLNLTSAMYAAQSRPETDYPGLTQKSSAAEDFISRKQF